MRRIFVFFAVLTVVSLPTGTAVAEPNCVGTVVPMEAKTLQPFGQNLAMPLATSAPGVLGTFVSGTARAEVCLPPPGS